MMRLLPLLIGLLGIAAAVPAPAQTPAAPPATNITPDQARAAIQVLNDPKQRAALTATLEAIARSQPAPAAPAPVPANEPAAQEAGKVKSGATVPLPPDSLGAQILVSGEAFLNRASNEAIDAIEAVQSLPLLWSWLVVMATASWAQNLLLDAAWRLAMVLLCALAVEFGLRQAVRRPMEALERGPPRTGDVRGEPLPEEHPAPVALGESVEARAEAGELEIDRRRRRPSARMLLRRLPLVLARLVLELVPVIGFVIVGHIIAGTPVGGAPHVRVVLLAVVDAYALWRALLAVTHMLLSPGAARLRLFDLPDSLATYLTRWTRRIVLIAVFGYAIAEVGLLLGLSNVAHDALLKFVGLLVSICLITVVVQKRRAIRRLLRTEPGAGGPIASIRNALAAVWHWVALFVIVAVWLVWAVDIPNAFASLVRFFVTIALVLISARLILIVLIGTLDQVLKVPGPDHPGLEARLRLYHPTLNWLIRAVVYVLSALVLLQLVGVAALAWLLETSLGQHLVEALTALGVTLLVALAVWEAANAALQAHLDRLTEEQQLARSARLRTLLPLLRSALAITIIVITGLIVLSQIGINIGPLLAGAGIVGVAIGFGSQKLMQDLITGVFLLLENAMQVGDWVTVSGLSGTVEALSIRTIRLRAGDGSVHIIPFSAVTSVTNVNRGLGNAPVNVTVDFEEDIDRVAAELTEIVAGMRTEPDFASKMLSDFQLWGVDKVDGATVTIAGQVVCTDAGRWAVQREFNRRMKMRFQELGIRLFNPTRTIAIPMSSPGSAPATIAKEPDHERRHAAD